MGVVDPTKLKQDLRVFWMQIDWESSRMYETMGSWENIAMYFGKNTKGRHSRRQAQFGNQWNVVQTTAGGCNTIATRQHPELGPAHRARMNHQSVQRATARRAGSSFCVTAKENILLLGTQPRIFRSDAGSVEHHTHFSSISFVFLLFSQYCCEEVV